MSTIEVTESATTEKPSEIRSISREDACKISSGQVNFCVKHFINSFTVFNFNMKNSMFIV